MNWNKLESESDLSNLLEQSLKNPSRYFLIFKHSTRCPVSAMALNRLEKKASELEIQFAPYFIDLLAFRNVSDKIAIEFKVKHESPQVLLIKEGKCFYNTSHHLITPELLLSTN
jgi:bacillithiol system protein YtxJ